MKPVTQILFKYDEETFGSTDNTDLPFAFITFNNDFEEFSSRVFAFSTKEDLCKNKGTLMFIDTLLYEYLSEYEAKILR